MSFTRQRPKKRGLSTRSRRKIEEVRKTLHKLKLDEHGVWLDDMLLQGVRSYDIHYNEKEGIDELTLHMDAVSNRHGNLDSFLEQGGKSGGSKLK